ncbi:transporter substrate-binding domain-containing protein [Fusibacter tunisiensis]|uniref:Polar amino acid transport system substrate-binding protein n=1 Tax=Fusibacter tunisiensis TaxID=1008308 RepID=A0ABS2MT15_9FIRM|nr:transporter substrate-binding domain-containing protein [Fusibacter tunisiensis]MBM7562545.1 polar amino acid transport system substrate-binding protein [Fusibacter tunisiensis]
MKKFLWLLAILTVLVSVASCSDANLDETGEEHSVLRVGMELKYPPFETKDASGNPEGVSVMLAEALGDYLDVEIEIVDTAYASLIPALEQGNIDIIISSMTITPAREELVDFSIPYTNSQLMLLAHKDSIVQSPDDLNNPEVVIASKSGTIGALWAAENAPLAKILNVEEEASAVLEVAQGSADVFIYDPLSIIRHHENYKETTRTILEPLPNTKGWGIAMRKGETDLKNQIDAFIEEAKTDGTYETIREAYLKEKIEEFESYGLEFFF